MARIECPARPIDPYASVVGDDVLTRIVAVAARLRGVRVLHLSATARGGGVAEVLRSQVPLLRGLGLEVEWHALEADAPFFALARKLRDGLQGRPVEFADAERALYARTLASNLAPFAERWDIVVVHDPQPAGCLGILDGRRTGRWVWRCHLDLSTPAPAALAFMAPLVAEYDATVFTLPAYAHPPLRAGRVEFVTPSIDPLALKNRRLPRRLARRVLARRFGIDPDRPLVTQVSRYDPWKDPLGVLDAYRAVRRRLPGVQLALVGNAAEDDPEGLEVLRRVRAAAAGEPDVHVLSTRDRLSRDERVHALEVAAFQSGSEVVVQKSTREGFGLVVTEAMWKGAAVVGGRVAGIEAQIEDGVTGCLVSSPAECAERVTELLLDPARRESLGARARESVRERFLLPRHLFDELRLYLALTGR